MTIDIEIEALDAVASRTGTSVQATDDLLTITSDGRTAVVPISATSHGWAPLDFRHALPGRARGDQREMLLSAIAQDATDGKAQVQSSKLSAALAQQDPALFAATDGWQRDEIAAVLNAQYFVSGRSRPFLFPFHAALPANFKQHGQYKMFRSDILLMLCWDGTDIDPAPVIALCNLLNDDKDLALLDNVMIEAALAFAGDESPETVSAEFLLEGSQAKKVREALKFVPAFAQESLDRFREDLLSALKLDLPRHDRVAAAIHTLSLHLGLYYYEVSARLGQGIIGVTHATVGDTPPPVTGIHGRLRFRVGTAGDRPVSRQDGCAKAWRELDDGHLIALSPNIITANHLHEIWKSADSSATSVANPEELAIAMGKDEDLRVIVDAGAASLAVLYESRAAGGDSVALQRVAQMEPGPHALRSTILEHRRKTLKHISRDVVNQLVKRPFGGSLVRTRGAVTFFELDEEFLFLLVKFILTRTDREELQFNRFLEELSQYGLTVQDDQERNALAGALERLGMLTRYSDAGEATYVRNTF